MNDTPKWAYRCTICGAMLNPGGPVYLVGEREGARDPARYLLGFHPEPGNYDLIAPPEVAFDDGER